LLSRTEVSPGHGPHYWARIPLDEGHAFELAGWEPLPSGRNTAFWINELLGSPAEPELVIYADPGRGVFRYASIVNDRLQACLFLARRGSDLPARDAVMPALGREVSAAARLALLGGRACADAPTSERRMVCACFSVGLETLRGAIVDRRLTSVAEVGAALRAGTNCGSCIPELSAILRGSATRGIPALRR
jgi:assimilatory nitrate reductase catalytic subunit